MDNFELGLVKSQIYHDYDFANGVRNFALWVAGSKLALLDDPLVKEILGV